MNIGGAAFAFDYDRAADVRVEAFENQIRWQPSCSFSTDYCMQVNSLDPNFT